MISWIQTTSEITVACYRFFPDILSSLNCSMRDMFFVEPSAGTGTFFDLLPASNRLGIDINPKRKDILSKDFFTITELQSDSNQTVIIGNPPFGKRGKMAIAFFNHGANLGDIIAFIVPVNFRKFIVHKQLNESMRFISKMELPRDAFYLESGNSYSVNTEFQIWTRLSSQHIDMRQYESLPIRHKDFQLWQYNNTVAARKVFENAFDFAVPCQGWQDYSRQETDEKRCERNKQWILIKANDTKVLSRLKSIDFGNLAKECGTAVPGFRKGDLVKAYSDSFENQL